MSKVNITVVMFLKSVLDALRDGDIIEAQSAASNLRSLVDTMGGRYPTARDQLWVEAIMDGYNENDHGAGE